MEAVPLFVKIDLMCCPFEDEKQSSTNADKDKTRDPNAPPPMTREQLLAKPSFKSVASQTLEIQRVGTIPQRNPGPSYNTYHHHNLHHDDKSAATRLLTVGDSVHQYYPIRFDRSHAVDMDCMIHCGVSGIHRQSIHSLHRLSTDPLHSLSTDTLNRHPQ